MVSKHQHNKNFLPFLILKGRDSVLCLHILQQLFISGHMNKRYRATKKYTTITKELMHPVVHLLTYAITGGGRYYRVFTPYHFIKANTPQKQINWPPQVKKMRNPIKRFDCFLEILAILTVSWQIKHIVTPSVCE